MTDNMTPACNDTISKIRNIGIMAHIDAGKPPSANGFFFIPARPINWARSMTARP
jgi:hypothetical protein